MTLKLGSPTADDLRSEGWSVAVHNDYRLNGQRLTFWLFTKDFGGSLRAAKGEGLTDTIALDQVRLCVALEPRVAEDGGIEPRSF